MKISSSSLDEKEIDSKDTSTSSDGESQNADLKKDTPSSDNAPASGEDNLVLQLFTKDNRLLTDEGASLAVPRDTRNLLAYFSDGSFLVSQANRYDGRVLSFEGLVKEQGLPLKKPVYTSLGTLNEVYKENVKRRDKNAPVNDDFNNQIQKDFIDIIANAADKHVSDIHVVVAETSRVYFRIDGSMAKVSEYDSQWGEAFMRSVFASADISDSNYAQNEFQSAQKLGDTPLRGSKDLYLPSGVLAIRLQFNPIAFGSQYLVMRLLYENKNKDLGLENQGATPYEIKRFERMRLYPTGLCVIAGPTGSGKSTTLAGNMNLMLKEKDYEINLITVEDPPEYPIPGAQQMPVTNAQTEEEKGLAFTNALAAALRSDPDALMVGEIRTLPAAQLTFKGALSGHNVWTTLHANAASTILVRLQDMGVESFKLTDPSLMKGLISQRLFKVLCPDCRKKLSDHPDDPTYSRTKRALGDMGLAQTYMRGEGCETCGGKGIIGRTAAFEMILPDADFLSLMQEGKQKEAIQHWLAQLNGRSLREAAIEKMLQGTIGISEIERWCGLIDEPEIY